MPIRPETCRSCSSTFGLISVRDWTMISGVMLHHLDGHVTEHGGGHVDHTELGEGHVERNGRHRLLPVLYAHRLLQNLLLPEGPPQILVALLHLSRLLLTARSSRRHAAAKGGR